jgi:hypothetical protein
LIGGVKVKHGQRWWLANALLAVGFLLCVALYVWPPAQFSFYPACPIHEFLHIDCPGCGATRALAALLRGHLREAMRLNALFVVLLPFGLGVAFECYRRAVRPGEFRWPVLPARALYATMAVAAMFTVVRNLVR